MKKYVLLVCCALMTLALGCARKSEVIYSVNNWKVDINPNTLEIMITGKEDNTTYLLVAGEENLGKAKNFKEVKGEFYWELENNKISVHSYIKNDKVHFKFSTKKEQQFNWPSGRNASSEVTSFQFPKNAGLDIPVNDQMWIDQFAIYGCHKVFGKLSMPFIGVNYKRDFTATYIFPNGIRSDICLFNEKGKLYTESIHHFKEKDNFEDYEVVLAISKFNPVSSAIVYKKWLVENKLFKSLNEKIKENPLVSKMIGATHAYLWGDGLTVSTIKSLHKMGLDRMWIGHKDETEEQVKEVLSLVEEGKSLGYIMGSYEIFNKLDPEGKERSHFSTWKKGSFPIGCIQNEGGELQEGIDENGCELSSEYLRMKEPSEGNIENRISRHEKNGVNSLYVDEDGYGIFYDDYNKNHLISIQRDRENIFLRLKMISDRGLVLGSEAAVGGFNPIIHFSHGGQTIHNDFLFKMYSDEKEYGDLGKVRSKNMFFKKSTPPDYIVKSNYNMKYRIPLFETVFHDAMITTERWDLTPVKLKGLERERELLRLLYNQPALWAIDSKELKMYGKRMLRGHQIFSRLHKALSLEPVSKFEWLSEDKLVQKMTYSDAVSLTANFSKKTFQGINSLCLKINWLREKRSEDYCPTKCQKDEDCF